jgi:hypothetical protein
VKRFADKTALFLDAQPSYHNFNPTLVLFQPASTSPYDPEWLARSHDLPEELVAGVAEGEEEAFVPSSSVLYELLTIYLILSAFDRRGFAVQREDNLGRISSSRSTHSGAPRSSGGRIL